MTGTATRRLPPHTRFRGPCNSYIIFHLHIIILDQPSRSELRSELSEGNLRSGVSVYVIRVHVSWEK